MPHGRRGKTALWVMGLGLYPLDLISSHSCTPPSSCHPYEFGETPAFGLEQACEDMGFLDTQKLCHGPEVTGEPFFFFF